MIPDGFTSEQELAWLQQAAEHHMAIVEIGCWIGRSTSVLAKTPGFVLCIDDWVGTDHGFLPTDVHDLPAGGLPEFSKNMASQMGKVVPLCMRSQDAAYLFPLPCFDMVFIDGDHRYRSVWLDIANWESLLKPGGLLCGHNYEPCWKDDVMRAVDELVPDRQLVEGTSLVEGKNIMANNRMYVVCIPCLEDEAIPFEDCTLYLGKYYATSGWSSHEGIDMEIKKFLMNHRHRSPLGAQYQLLYESMTSQGQSKAALLEALAQLGLPR